MKVQPLYDRVLLKRLELQEVKKGGIIIPDTAKEKPQEAEVIEAGKGRVTDEGKTVALQVKKGDTVLIGKYSGTEVTVDDVELVIVREDEILAVITK
ncbi:MAG: co-chaperone GroES [Acidobacteriota bacterium]|jgi:chaperonin GroES|nr:co-chaperone GroES [Acidobacteriota bacterium]